MVISTLLFVIVILKLMFVNVACVDSLLAFLNRSVEILVGGGGVGTDPATTVGCIALIAPVLCAAIMLMCLIGFGGRLGKPWGS